MEQETKTIKFPISGKEAEYKTYLTAGDYIDIENTPDHKRQQVAIEKLVLKFDGSDKDIYDRIRKELRAKDYMLIEKELLEIILREVNPDEKKN